MLKKLTNKQRNILEFMRREFKKTGLFPTSREISVHFGYASPKAAIDHIHALIRKGYLIKLEGRKNFAPSPGYPLYGVPILGRVPAGEPIFAEENYEGRLEVGDVFGDPANLIALRVRGDSMKNAHIVDGDYIVIRKGSELSNGQIGVVFVDGEATLKRVFRKGSEITVKPENPEYKERQITIREGEDSRVQVCGKVVGVLRRVAR